MITPEKKLRAGRSLWAGSPGVSLRVSRLSQSIKADVAIIGAGISGAFMAQALASRFENVVVLDRRSPAHGSTEASTALLQFEIDVPLIRLREKIGAGRAARAWLHSLQATQHIVQLVEQENIRCGLQRRGSLYLAGNEMGRRALQQEAAARNRAGLPGDFLSCDQLQNRFGIGRGGAILSPGSAVANPMQLAAGLLRRAHVKIYTPVEVRDVLATKHGITLDAGDHFVEARYAIFCTGYEALKSLPKTGTKITSSWAIASPRMAYPEWLDEVVLWEAAKPYLYMRSAPGHRLIIGGEDEDIDLPSYRARSLPQKTARLIAKTQSLIPGLELKAATCWTGAFGESLDGLPFIDAVPGLPGCFAVMGFGGNGTVYSRIAAEIMPGLLAGRPPKEADLYRFERN